MQTYFLETYAAWYLPRPHDTSIAPQRKANPPAPGPAVATSDEARVTPIMRVANADAAAAWYARLGFTVHSVHRFAPHLPAFMTVRRGDIQLFLSEHTGDARPDTLIYLSVRDVEPIAEEFGVTIEEAPWGREIALRDPDGNRVRIGSPKR